ncbi:MAG: murein L,D-transpeptidase [Devosia sp.]|uniref:L,D-transpeptidase family protein n=1 Tax=Devosia sp. TaxID=1871048 RepID=UPI0024CD8021|nr:murein L,D-transpeptidase family protein [Devosia sp.]UYN98478.1 MAG: murein L,D-transpeptidase [Devosia sp.]
MNASFFHRLGAAIIVLWLSVGLAACSSFVKDSGPAKANQPLSSAVLTRLAAINSSARAPMMIRVFKQEAQLEVWKQTTSGQYALFKSYAICRFSGDIGPKFKEGDYQSPEGFYNVTPGQMNPYSSYYLSFNVGFPNKFDRVHGRTGSNLMVHGDCLSVGCYAMTDAGIAEIYALARETFKGGNPSFQLQLFPFRMSTAQLVKHADNQHLGFWQDIKEGFDYFELTKTPPVWDVCEKQYIFNPATRGALDPAGACPQSNRSPELMARIQADTDALGQRALVAERKAAEDAALKARGDAVSSFFSSIGNAVTGGGGTDVTAETPAN